MSLSDTFTKCSRKAVTVSSQVSLPQSQGTVFWYSPWSQPCAAGDCSPACRFWHLPAAPLPTTKANNNGICYRLFYSGHFHLSNIGVTYNINKRNGSASPRYCTCRLTNIDYWHLAIIYFIGHMCFFLICEIVCSEKHLLIHIEKCSFLLLTSRKRDSYRCYMQTWTQGLHRMLLNNYSTLKSLTVS